MLSTKIAPLFAKCLDDVLIVNDLVVDVDRRPKFL